MKLEIDIPSILYNDAKENRGYISVGKMEIAWKAIADGKPLKQEPQTFKWCDTCKEYDQEKHCCHRWSRIIRDTVEEMKQEYIEREVLDKIRAEIEYHRRKTQYIDPYDLVGDCLDILDRYKAESEE